jgi:hypothetical protein
MAFDSVSMANKVLDDEGLYFLRNHDFLTITMQGEEAIV